MIASFSWFAMAYHLFEKWWNIINNFSALQALVVSKDERSEAPSKYKDAVSQEKIIPLGGLDGLFSTMGFLLCYDGIIIWKRLLLNK